MNNIQPKRKTMSTNSGIVIVVACCAIFASPLNAGASEHRTKHHRHFAKKLYNPSPRRTTEGEQADKNGWRKRDNAGWDNSCINLPYLPSQYACSTGGGDGI